MDTLLTELRLATRAALKSPGFTAIVVLTLAFGIGANTAIFSVVDAVLLTDLPYRESATLVRITGEFRGAGIPDSGISVPELDDYRRRSDLFSEVCGIYPITANITGGDQPERVETLLVSGNYFTMLGAHAAMGRVFESRDEIPGIAEIAVISDGLWRRRFGSDPDIIGRKVRLDEDNYTIVGVMPRAFRHPGRTLATDVEFWAPTGFRAAPFRAPSRGAYFLDGGLGRLAPGVSPAYAHAKLEAMGRDLRKLYPNDYTEKQDWHPRAVPLKEDLTGNVRPALLTLFAAVAMVLLIACVNVANLLLARATARQREIAIRRALGAGRARLIRQMLIESLLLSVCGGLVACLVTLWAVDLLLRLTPASMPRLHEVAPNVRVFLFTLGMSLATGLLFGLAPAIETTAPDMTERLRDGGRSGIGSSQQRVRRALVVAEFAIALVLLAGAGLLIRSFAQLMRVDLGFQADRVMVARMWLPQPNDPPTGPYFTAEKRLVFVDEVLRRVRSLPGVELAAIATNAPLDGSRVNARFTVETAATSTADATAAHIALVSADYFDVLRIPVIDGRVFTLQDDAKAPPVVAVNEVLARKYWPGENAVGKRLKMGSLASASPWMTIVAIVRDVKTDSPEAANRPQIYRPMTQVSTLNLTLVARTGIDPGTFADAARREIAAVDPRIPVYGIQKMEDVVGTAVAERRFATLVLGIFAAVALFLAAIGIYGVMAYSVTQRTQEIGIRMALGARRGHVHRLIIGQGLGMTAAGITFGLLLAVMLTRLIRNLLYGVKPADPATFGAVAILLAIVAMTACYLPARRAAAVEPMRALREE